MRLFHFEKHFGSVALGTTLQNMVLLKDSVLSIRLRYEIIPLRNQIHPLTEHQLLSDMLRDKVSFDIILFDTGTIVLQITG